MDFRKHIVTDLIKKSDRIIEFGPLDRPIVNKKDFKNAYYADIRDTNGVKELYSSNEYLKSTGVKIDVETIVDIDYVVKGTYEQMFHKEKKFDVAILSHVIEHMPDIIAFFKDISSILTKNGKLILIYPDSRYSFDHYRVGTRFIDALLSHTNKEINTRAVFDFSYNVIKGNIPADYWSGGDISAIKLPTNSFDDSIKKLDLSSLDSAPDDMHFWPFADYQFVKFLYDLDRAGISDFEIDECYQTQFNTQEFMIVLSRKKPGGAIDYPKYQRFVHELSPESKQYRSYIHTKALEEANTSLTEANTKLNNENLEIKNELSGVYASKRWKLTAGVAGLISRVRK